MYYLAIGAFFVSICLAFYLGEMVGRNAEQVAQRRRREWQYRINEARSGK